MESWRSHLGKTRLITRTLAVHDRPAWDLVVITLCGLGLALSVTAMVIA